MAKGRKDVFASTSSFPAVHKIDANPGASAIECASNQEAISMIRCAAGIFVATLLGSATINAQTKLSSRWEELTASDFRQAIQQSKGTCLLPFGILEKHGPHLPLGTDLLNVRYASLQAVSQEYAVVFPEYYFGQIFEAKHEPGTVAYSMELQLRLLQETTDEMARNGCRKIIIVNGHGGNSHLLPFFAQAQLDKPHDYVVYVLDGERHRSGGPAKKSAGVDYHAGEDETANTMGDGSVARKELGDWNMKGWIDSIVECLRAVKADDASLKIQNEFYEKSKHPLDTRP
jgi:creatinine amidohydrolase